eukprot:2959088-Rhodomonas_salina.3
MPESRASIALGQDLQTSSPSRARAYVSGATYWYYNCKPSYVLNQTGPVPGYPLLRAGPPLPSVRALKRLP